MKRIYFLIFAYAALCLVMFILPFYTVDGYSLIQNTTSELGAQNTPNAWIMNITFTFLGVVTFFAGWGHYAGYWLHRIFLLIFCASLVLVSEFQHAPIDPEIIFDPEEDRIHSLLATIIGISFTFLAMATGFVKHVKTEKIIPIVIALTATGLPALMFIFEDYMGLFQRLLFVITFGWLIYEFRRKLNWR